MNPTFYTLTALWLAPLAALGAELSNPAQPGLPSVGELHAAAEKRCDWFFRSQASKPLVASAIKTDWDNRGDFTRHYGQSIVLFAMRAFYLNEQVEEANRALRELCQYHLDRPQTLLEIHSFPSICDPLLRLCKFYGPCGSRAAGRMSAETHRLVVKTMWAWASMKSKLAEAEVKESQTWILMDSENHHAQHFSTCWGFSMILADEPEYRDRAFEDGHTAAEHHEAWSAYLREYLRQRACKGMLVEIDSPSYAAATLKGIYSLYDFSADPVLKRRAGDFLTLYWALWAEQQLDAVCGGAKTRCYPDSAERGDDFLRRAAWYALGVGDPEFVHASMLPFVTTTWRMPELVSDLALDREGRGSYEVRQRRMGLVEPGFDRPPQYRLRADFGGILRYGYCTPDFIMGSLLCEARPYEDWAAISAQNRWAGVIFHGATDARIYPACVGEDHVLNAMWAVQRHGTLIWQKLKTNRNAKELRVWFSKAGLSAPLREGPWYFAEAAGAWAAVRVISGEAALLADSESRRGRWLKCSDDFSPVILEVARKGDFPSFDAFRRAVLARPLEFDAGVLSYTGLGGDRFTFFTDYSGPPRINGQPVDFAPAKVFDSPFVQSARDSGVVTLQKGDRQLMLDFNVTELQPSKALP